MAKPLPDFRKGRGFGCGQLPHSRWPWIEGDTSAEGCLKDEGGRPDFETI